MKITDDPLHWLALYLAIKNPRRANAIVSRLKKIT